MENIAHLIAPTVATAAAGAVAATAMPAAASYARQLGTAFVATVKSPQMLGTIGGGVVLYMGVSIAAGALMLGGMYAARNGVPLIRRAYNATTAAVSELTAKAEAPTDGPVIDGQALAA